MKKIFPLLMLVPALMFVGCAKNQAAQQAASIKPSVPSPATAQKELSGIPATSTQTPEPTSTAEEITARDFFAPVIKDGYIYCFDQKVGAHKNNRLYMRLDEKVVSFAPPKLSGTEVEDFQIKDLTCESSNMRPNEQGGVDWQYSNFDYAGLELSTRLYGPYALYKAIETPADNNKITYRCDGSLAKTGDTIGSYTKNEPYFYCQTNNKDFLTQYEFNGADGDLVLTTGGDYGKEWKKIYIKRLAGLNYIFMGSVSLGYEDVWSSDYTQEKFIELSSKKALDELLKNPKNSRTVALWQMLVDSFKVEDGDVYGLLNK